MRAVSPTLVVFTPPLYRRSRGRNCATYTKQTSSRCVVSTGACDTFFIQDTSSQTWTINSKFVDIERVCVYVYVSLGYTVGIISDKRGGAAREGVVGFNDPRVWSMRFTTSIYATM